MKIAIWCTGHEIADTVAEALAQGLGKSIAVDTLHAGDSAALGAVAAYDAHIGYGILRGMDGVFSAAAQAKVPWFCIDRGYWKPGHYAGLYRISLNGTQQTTGLDRLAPDYDRLATLGIEIEPRKIKTDQVLVCPPTEAVCQRFGIDSYTWAVMHAGNTHNYTFRTKGEEAPIDYELYGEVITFNSAVGWEALRRGIQVTSDETHSILGAYQKQVDQMTQLDLDSRRRFFAVQAGLQLTLKEIRQGYAWPLIARLMSGLAGMPAKV